jgi:hypothetical protein
MTTTEQTTLSPRALLIALTPLAVLLVFVPGGKFLLPLLAPLALYPELSRLVLERSYGRAWGLGMGWAALLSASVIALVHLTPEAAAAGILNGEPYRAEMFGWIATGEGREVSPSLFLPEHALHLVAFVVLCWLSASYLGLVLGAMLTAYMSYFVGSYAAAAQLPLLGSIAAWVPWSVVRVAAFVLLGVLFARPLLVRRVWPFERRELRLIGLALLGIAVDVTMKVLLAPWYGEMLRGLAEGRVPPT